MERGPSYEGLNRKVIDSLYVEAMVLADEARAYFDRAKDAAEMRQTPILRVALSCEAIKVTTRLMNLISWLLTRRAIAKGENAILAPKPLAHIPPSPGAELARLPGEARAIIEASIDLYARVARIDLGPQSRLRAPSPVRTLISQLESAF